MYKIFIHSLYSDILEEGIIDISGIRDRENESSDVMSSFSLGGATFIFPNTSVYPEATQRITTRPGMNNDNFLYYSFNLSNHLFLLLLLFSLINDKLNYEYIHMYTIIYI